MYEAIHVSLTLTHSHTDSGQQTAAAAKNAGTDLGDLAKHAQRQCRTFVPLCSRRTAASIVTKVHVAQESDNATKELVSQAFTYIASYIRHNIEELLVELRTMQPATDTPQAAKLLRSIAAEMPALCIAVTRLLPRDLVALGGSAGEGEKLAAGIAACVYQANTQKE